MTSASAREAIGTPHHHLYLPTPAQNRVLETALEVAPARPLRTLDALHLATYLLARRRIAGLELLAADQRLAEAAGTR